MSTSAIGSIIRAATRRPDEPLNILTFSTHEAYQSNLAKLPHHFYLYEAHGTKKWNGGFRPLPANHTRIAGSLPPGVDLDLVWSQEKNNQYPIAKQISEELQLPLVAIEHTLPHPDAPENFIKGLKAKQPVDIQVFISEYSRKKWGWEEDEALVLHHGIDTELFTPHGDRGRERVCLSVVNDWKNRNWCQPAGQKLWTTLGFIPVEDIQVGHKVLSDDGTVNQVTRVFERDYFGDLVEISIGQAHTLRFTPDHNIRVFRDGQWAYVDASRLRAGDRLRFPDPVQTDFTWDGDDQSWLIGLIVGDGSITKKGTISIVFQQDDTENIAKAHRILSDWVGVATVSERHRNRGGNVVTVEATSKIFGAWLKSHVGSKASKSLPDFIMNGSTPSRLHALQGLWSADGSFKNGHGHSPRACYSTISPRLAAQVSQLLHSFGVSCSVRREKRTTNKSNGQELPIYRVTAYGRDNVDKCVRLITKGEQNPSVSYEVSSVSVQREWTGKVYNCEVENDPSYTVYPGFVAHNCCGYDYWEEATRGLPVKVLGDTPGLSKPAGSPQELAAAYRGAQIFVNTSTVSPVPTALLEAMASGCCVVSTRTCMIPEIVYSGVNGFLCDSPHDMQIHLKRLLADPALCADLGQAARQTVLEKFNLTNFAVGWHLIFQKAINEYIPGVQK
jgi:glycosyltransferase involved in cell wall biosynthesis